MANTRLTSIFVACLVLTFIVAKLSWRRPVPPEILKRDLVVELKEGAWSLLSDLDRAGAPAPRSLVECDPLTGLDRAATEIVLANSDLYALLQGSVVEQPYDIYDPSERLARHLDNAVAMLGQTYQCWEHYSKAIDQAVLEAEGAVHELLRGLLSFKNSGYQAGGGGKWEVVERGKEDVVKWQQAAHALAEMRGKVDGVGHLWALLRDQAGAIHRKAQDGDGHAVRILARSLVANVLESERDVRQAEEYARHTMGVGRSWVVRMLIAGWRYRARR